MKAAALLMERFPALGLMSFQWKPKKVSEEVYPEIPLEGFQALYVYGLGNGSSYLQYRSWLKEKSERRLIFLENDERVLGAFLHGPYAEEVLSDTQVHLELFSKDNLQNLVDQFPFEKVEVVAPVTRRGVKTLRLEILRKTTLAHSLHIDRLHGHELFAHFLKNLTHLPGSFYANALKGAFKNVPAIICGAGPSLEATIETLRGLEDKALIIAGGSSLAALSSQGVKVHFGMAIDPNLEEYTRMKNSFAFETPLLYSTRVHPSIFQTCSGPFGYLRAGIGGVGELWMEEELGLLDELVGKSLSNETMSVTAICVAWAQFLGCSPILLNGIDMAYTGKKRYASGVVEDVTFKKSSLEQVAQNQIIRKKDRLGKFVDTAVRWVMESATISKFAKKHPKTRFINTTDGGIGFEGVEYVPLQKAAQNFKSRQLEKRVREKIAAARMPKKTATIIKTKTAELKMSLDRLIGHLEVLSGLKKGSHVLAEVEIREEIAFLYLFYDIQQIFRNDSAFWKKWLELAMKYRAVFFE